MTLSDLASLGSFVSGVAVLISLIYLALQVRQAEKNQRATIRTERTSRFVAISIGATEPSLANALYKALTSAQDIMPTQVLQVSRYAQGIFKSYEDSFDQHRDGLMTESDFRAFINTARGAVRQPGFRVLWKRSRSAYGTEFVDFMDTLVAKTPVEPLSWDPTEWLNDLARESPG
jgi:hypothetical protein